MSYSIDVTVSEGTPTVTTSGQLPDGKYVIRGHIDDQREDIGAERITTTGNLASRSSGTVYMEVQ